MNERWVVRQTWGQRFRLDRMRMRRRALRASRSSGVSRAAAEAIVEREIVDAITRWATRLIRRRGWVVAADGVRPKLWREFETGEWHAALRIDTWDVSHVDPTDLPHVRELLLSMAANRHVVSYVSVE